MPRVLAFALVMPERATRISVGCTMSISEYTPGSPEAIARGCTCSPVLNPQGGTVAGPSGPVYQCDPECPLHGLGIVRRAVEEGGPSIVRSLDDLDELEPISRGGPGIGELEVNAGKPWSDMDIADLRQSAAFGSNDLEIGQFLCRPVAEIRDKAAELGISIRSAVQ
jgi:hypothetical protein